MVYSIVKNHIEIDEEVKDKNLRRRMDFARLQFFHQKKNTNSRQKFFLFFCLNVLIS